MKKVGIVTLYSNNYGSTLQCYALKTTINKLNYECNVISVKLDEDEIYISKLNTLVSIFKNSFLHPSYLKSYIAKRKSGQASINSLDYEAAIKLNSFVKRIIAPRYFSLKQLRKIGVSNQYCAFVAGSDQVWNGLSPFQPFYFLDFAEKSKRIAYAPSFGGNTIASYNKSYFRNAIRSFQHVSVRENDGVKLVKELIGQDVKRVPDPTFLLSNKEWSDFACKELLYTSYILVHFLDRPNDIPINMVRMLQNETGKKLLVFSYMHQEFEAFDFEFYSGTPEEYVAYIKNADFVLTDSFHTATFSLRFNCQTYIFDRQYQNGQDQFSRIYSFLENTNYLNRLINFKVEKLSDVSNEMHDISDWIDGEKKIGFDYLCESLPVEEDANRKIKQYSECTGCGGCIAVCPVDAISFGPSELGYSIPIVNSDKCVNCNKCVDFCRNSIKRINSPVAAYIAYAKDHILRNNAASGGAFATIAKQFIRSGGIVCGASLFFEDGNPIIKHILVKDEEKLSCILGSKYVQSDCVDIYGQIKTELQYGNKVLFCGTSCQVFALLNFVGNFAGNLYTIDFVCHGIPGQDLFREYIRIIEKENRKKVSSYSFRNKVNGKIDYIENITFEDGDVLNTLYNDSLYCKLFLGRVSYREQCYSCEYASINKPSDLTLGDYFEAKNDYPDLFSKGAELYDSTYLSCLLVNSTKGQRMINDYGNDLCIVPIDIKKVQLSHEQLCVPSKYPNFRDKFKKLYSKNGLKTVEDYYVRRNMLLCIPRKIMKR